MLKTWWGGGGGAGVGGEGGLEGEGQQGERYRIEALSKAKRPLRLCMKYNINLRYANDTEHNL